MFIYYTYYQSFRNLKIVSAGRDSLRYFGVDTWDSFTFKVRNARSFMKIKSKKQDYGKSLSI